ncbi:hypothetical protein IEQ34_020400 [Dendrobium chrysotoxum]|uniref:Uncharacterized protein n=1 Tax=Dendrobium chrysotoxum TaxID=161865 RepID=A0AAV7G1W5_DENCH|nr:hypothetical protein IEQ34_020400 [Dendrobium chrysotoxum]
MAHGTQGKTILITQPATHHTLPVLRDDLAAPAALSTRHEPRPSTSITVSPSPFHLFSSYHPPHPPHHFPKLPRFGQLHHLLNTAHVSPSHEQPWNCCTLPGELPYLLQILPVKRNVTLVNLQTGFNSMPLHNLPQPLAILESPPHPPQRRRVKHNPVRVTWRLPLRIPF